MLFQKLRQGIFWTIFVYCIYCFWRDGNKYMCQCKNTVAYTTNLCPSFLSDLQNELLQWIKYWQKVKHQTKKCKWQQYRQTRTHTHTGIRLFYLCNIGTRTTDQKLAQPNHKDITDNSSRTGEIPPPSSANLRHCWHARKPHLQYPWGERPLSIGSRC